MSDRFSLDNYIPTSTHPNERGTAVLKATNLLLALIAVGMTEAGHLGYAVTLLILMLILALIDQFIYRGDPL